MKLATSIPSKPKANTANWATALFSVAVYSYAVSALISWWLFLVPDKHLWEFPASVKLYSMDTAPVAGSVLYALAQNIGAMLAFGFAHSFFARKSIKMWMALPASMERSFYCLQGAWFLHMVQKHWLESDIASTAIWDVSDSAVLCYISLATFWFGGAILLSATFALDHFYLFGLSQAFGVDLNKMMGLTPLKLESGLATRWHYRWVAHPIMTGALLNFWATPIMTPSRFVMALVMTAYIVVAVTKLEEPSLREELGEPYHEYLKKTPRFFPNLPYKLKISIEKMTKED